MDSRPLLVMKFGGAAVATAEHFSHIADIILSRQREGYRMAIVVSAMGGETDRLIALAKSVNSSPPQREMDMLISVGERVSISLLAMALAAKGCYAVSFTGSQSGIITSENHGQACIVAVKPYRLVPHLEKDQIVIVAGFQGVSSCCDITTLGRGGSDTSAVALAVALGAQEVEFYKDVDAVFDEDPKSNKDAKAYRNLSYEKMQKVLFSSKHYVLHPRAVSLAQKNGMPLRVRPFKDLCSLGTLIANDGVERALHPVFEDEKTSVQ